MKGNLTPLIQVKINSLALLDKYSHVVTGRCVAKVLDSNRTILTAQQLRLEGVWIMFVLFTSLTKMYRGFKTSNYI